MFKETGPENEGREATYFRVRFLSPKRAFLLNYIGRSHLTAVHLRSIVHIRVFICPITKLYENLTAILLNICKYYQGVKSIKLQTLIHFLQQEKQEQIIRRLNHNFKTGKTLRRSVAIVECGCIRTTARAQITVSAYLAIFTANFTIQLVHIFQLNIIRKRPTNANALPLQNTTIVNKILG